jgi:CheY-like chemotaxis protein
MKTIFIVEPDPVLLRNYVDVLGSDDRQIVTFRTAQLAVKALNKLIPNVIVLELALPSHNGFELLYELRSYADTRRTKVIVNSLLTESEIDFGYVSKQSLGISAYLHKQSSSLEELQQVVSEAII